MKKQNIFSLIFVSMLLGCSAQNKQTRKLDAYDKLIVSGAVSVFYRSSDTLSVEVKGSSSDLEKLETKVENGTLMVGTKGSFSGPVYLYLSNKNLSALDVTGSSEFKAENEILTPNINLTVSGSSDVKLKYAGHRINCLQSGASNVNIKGSCDSLVASVTGASTFKSYGLSSKTANIVTSGASTAKVFATETLRANATGASDIKIKGDPKEVSAEASTAASISRVNDDKHNSGSEGDTVVYNWNNHKVLIINDDMVSVSHHTGFKHWRGFSMAVNGYLNGAGGTNMLKGNEFMELNYGKSFNYQFNLFERNFNIVGDRFKVVTGFGFDYHLYEFANKTNLNADTNYTYGIIDGGGEFRYLKNKLRCTYIQVPLLIEFNSSDKPSKAFHIAAGVVGQFLISSRTKQIVDDGSGEIKKVRKDNYNLSPFAAKAHVNLGYRGFTVFGEYSLTQFFQPGNGPELYPFAVGVRLVPFG